MRLVTRFYGSRRKDILTLCHRFSRPLLLLKRHVMRRACDKILHVTWTTLYSVAEHSFYMQFADPSFLWKRAWLATLSMTQVALEVTSKHLIWNNFGACLQVPPTAVWLCMHCHGFTTASSVVLYFASWSIGYVGPLLGWESNQHALH